MIPQPLTNPLTIQLDRAKHQFLLASINHHRGIPGAWETMMYWADELERLTPNQQTKSGQHG